MTESKPSQSSAPQSTQTPKPAGEEKKSFWSTLPGLLTAVGGMIAGVAALINALSAMGVIGRAKPTPVPPTPVPSPTVAVSATIAPTAKPTADLLLFADDFSNPQSGWYTETNPDSERLYQDGEFRIAVFAPQFESWAYSQQFSDLTDCIVEVDARRVEGPLNNDYGVLVRSPEDVDGFYMFGISSDGHYWVQKSVGDGWEEMVSWTPSDAVRQGSAVNHLRVECEGSHFSFLVNSRLLCEVDDESYASGDIGLVAGTFDETGVIVHFDNLRVSRLK